MRNSTNENELKSGFIFTVAIIMLSSFWSRILGAVWLSNTFYAVSLVVIVIKYFSLPKLQVNMQVILIIILTVISMTSGIMSGAKLNVDYFLHAGITTCVFMCLDMCANRKIVLGEAARRNLFLIFIVSGIILELYYYFGGLKYAHISQSASLNLDNPNEAGLWMASYITILAGSVFVLKGWWRISAFVASVFLFPILYESNSRNSLYAAILFVFMTVISYLIRLKTIPKTVLLLIAALPVIVFFVYMLVVIPNEEKWNISFLSSKGIDSREEIWGIVFNDLKKCFWIGGYAKYYDRQVHNSLMTLYCRYGAIYLVCAVGIIHRSLKKVQVNLSVYAALGLCGLLFTGCFEGSLFVGVAGLYLMILIVPILLKSSYYKAGKAR